MGIKRGLTLNQKLSLLPASIPDCVLDFLEDFNNADPLTTPKTQKAVKREYLEKNHASLRKHFLQMRELGELTEVEGRGLPRQYPGGFMIKLTFERGVRGLGFIVAQGTAYTGLIGVIVVQDDGFSEDYLKERLATFYKK